MATYAILQKPDGAIEIEVPREVNEKGLVVYKGVYYTYSSYKLQDDNLILLFNHTSEPFEIG